MFQFLKRHIIKAISSLRRGGRHCHFGMVFQVGGESGQTFFAFFTLVSSKHTFGTMDRALPSFWCKQDFLLFILDVYSVSVCRSVSLRWRGVTK